jgi:peptidoglycan/LPS O-acetylase OafA/YrhL
VVGFCRAGSADVIAATSDARIAVETESGLARAFSLRRNVRALVTPAQTHLRPIDGLRALSILWVVLFHVGWYTPEHLTPVAYFALVKARWMLPLWRGDFGVDVFFVLSGLLIAGMLIDERAKTGRLRLGLFYARRLLRLWPALVAALVLDVLLIRDHPDMTWANLLYVSNFLPIQLTGMGWCWSLAIEEQFYLLCPWLIGALASRGAGARAAVLGALLLGLAGVAAAIVVTHRFHAIDAEIVITRDLRSWARAFDVLYSKPWMRAGPLLAGVSAAYVLRSPRAMEALARSRFVPALGLVAALAFAVAATTWELFANAPRGLEVAYLATFRTVFGASVAYVAVLSLSQHPVGRALGRLLSARALYPIAQLSYAAYLLNPVVTQLVHRAMAPMIHDGGVHAIALLAPIDLAATFAGATLLHLLVERPFMQLRPSAAVDAVAVAPPAPAAASSKGFFSLDLLDNRFPVLHGMRVIAIITVVAYHVTWIFMGEQGIQLDPLFFAQSLCVFFGMDLFFVLSGFLIGSILLRSMSKSGTADIGRFYVRRIFRTFPSYYLVLAALAIAFPLTIAQRHHLGWEVLYGTNFLPLMRGQTVMFWGWSLALEEQFYLTVPLLFFALQRLGTVRARLVLLTALWALALVIRLAIYFRHRPWTDGELYGAVYFRTHTRFDPLIAGIIIAVVHQRWGKELTEWLKAPLHRALLSLPGLGLLWVLLRPSMFGLENIQFVHLFAWGTLTSLMYFSLVPMALYTGGFVCRWLSAPLFRRMATLGYGVYLVHIPIIDHVMVPIAKAAQDRHVPMLIVWPAALTCTMILSLSIGYVLHVLVEKPSLRIRERFAA